MDLLIDTHVLVWAGEGSRRLSETARLAVIDPDNRLYASAVTAWEFADLRSRGRLPAIANFGEAVRQLRLRLLDFPASLWSLADGLPNIHGDPHDRMLIAHAIHTDMPLLTADVTMRSYPVRSVW